MYALIMFNFGLLSNSKSRNDVISKSKIDSLSYS